MKKKTMTYKYCNDFKGSEYTNIIRIMTWILIYLYYKDNDNNIQGYEQRLIFW